MGIKLLDNNKHPRRMRGARLGRTAAPIINGKSKSLAIFKLLAYYRYLRTGQVWELLPPEVRGTGTQSQKKLVELMGRLVDHQYAEWPPGARKNPNYWYSQGVLGLDQKGYKALDAHCPDTPYNTLNARARIGKAEEFPHAMMQIDTMFAIERGVNADPNATLLRWGDIMEQAPNATFKSDNPFRFPKVQIEHWYKRHLNSDREEAKLITGTAALIPDIITAIDYEQLDGEVLFIIECENGNPVRRSNLQDNSALKKLLGYRELRRLNLFETHLGYRAVICLFVFSDEYKVQEFLDLILYETKGQGSKMFAATHLPEFGTTPEANPTIPDLYKTVGWKRAGFPDLYLNDPK